MEWPFSHPEEPNVEDDELARALAMSLAPAPVSEKEPVKLVVEYTLFYLGQSQPIGEKDVVVVEVEEGSIPPVLARDIKVAIKTQRAMCLAQCDAAEIALANAASGVTVPSDDITTFAKSGRLLKALAPPPRVTYEGDGYINVATRQGDLIGKFEAGTSAKVVIASCNSKSSAISGLLTFNGVPLKESLELMPGVYEYFPGARRIYENVTLYTVEETADDNFPRVKCRIVDKTRDHVQALVGQGSFIDLGDSAVEDMDLSILREASVDALRDNGRYLVVPVFDRGVALLNKWKPDIVEDMQAAVREFARQRLKEGGEVGVTCDYRKSWNHTDKKGEHINLELDVLVMSDQVVYIVEVKTSAGQAAVIQLEKSFKVVRRGLEEKIEIFEPLRSKELRGAIYSGTWSPSLKEEIEKHGWELWSSGGGCVQRGNCCDNAVGGIPGCPGSTSPPRAKAKGAKFPAIPQVFDLLKVGASRTSGLGTPHSKGRSGIVHEFRWANGHRKAPHLRTVGVNASVVHFIMSTLNPSPVTYH